MNMQISPIIINLHSITQAQNTLSTPSTSLK